MILTKRQLKQSIILSFFIFHYSVFRTQNAGINFSYMDASANPRNDFYTFSNGSWQKTFELPASDARYGSFNEINDNNLKKIKLILDVASTNKNALPNTDAQRLRDFYNTAMDSIKLEAQKLSPILAQIALIDSCQTTDELLLLKSDFDFIGVELLFGAGVSPDLKNSKKNIFGINQGGLGLGDKDYYTSEKYEDIRKEYITYMTRLFMNLGIVREVAKEFAENVLRFETKVAIKSLTRVEMRDVQKLYNPYSQKMLNELTPHIKWNDYFTHKKITQPDTVIVGMVDYLKNIDWLLQVAPVENIKLYFKARLLMESAPYLNTNAVKVHFHFRGEVMSGTRTMKPRWQRVQSVMNGCIGDIVSQEYVKKYFTPEAKLKVNKLIDNLVLAYRERIQSRDWMSAETKKQANRKLDLMIRKIGYPTKWKNYTGLVIGTKSYWDNICNANRFLAQDNLNDLKKPVDRYKWQMTPVTVNAYYDPTTNEITFPAAILQEPFFDPKADEAANYGTMGSIIGHELTHGFDDQGSQFDANGNMRMWWTPEDFKNFRIKTERIVEQFNNYVALDSLHVNGAMTQGENIADLGGLTMSYRAYKKSLAGAKSKKINDFTGEQRFFIAWAQGWKSKTRDEELRRLLTIDYHSPAHFRAFAPLSNMKEFYEAFDVKPGDKMYTPEEKRVEIW